MDRSGSAKEPTSPVDPQEAITLLLRELTQFHQTLQLFGVEPNLVTQAFRQVFYYICACSLNNLLLRREMCHWSKGISYQLFLNIFSIRSSINYSINGNEIRYSNPIQYIALGAVGARPAHQRAHRL